MHITYIVIFFSVPDEIFTQDSKAPTSFDSYNNNNLANEQQSIDLTTSISSGIDTNDESISFVDNQPYQVNLDIRINISKGDSFRYKNIYISGPKKKL